MKNKYELPSAFEVYVLEQERKKKSRKNIFIIVGVVVTSWIIAICLLVTNEQPPTVKPSAKKANNYKYTILKKDQDSHSFSNFYLLINTPDQSQDNLQSIALGLKDTLCIGQCNINFYLNKNAYLMDQKLDKVELDLSNQLANGSLSKSRYKIEFAKCEEKYYIKIADGLIGYLPFDSNVFVYYPYQDWHYEQLGGKNAHKAIEPEPDATTEPTNQVVNTQLSKDDQQTKGIEALASVQVYVKDNMNDPDSYEEISSNYSYQDTYFIIEIKFRGKNSFGAKVINYVKAKTDLDGNILQINND